MNSKIATIGIFAVLMCAVFAGVAFEVDAETTPTTEGAGSEGASGETGSTDPAPTPETSSYAVTFKVGEMSYSKQVSQGSYILPTLAEIGAVLPEGKTFGGWILAEQTFAPGSTVPISGATTFDAKLSDAEFTATFKAADKTINTVKGTLADAKDLAVLAPVAPIIDGKIFAGWQIDGAGDVIKTADLGKLKADVTYVAAYVVDYKITFIDGDKTYMTKVSDLVVPDLGDRTGFAFLGWFIGVEQVDPATYAYVKDTTLTAKWEPMNVYVTFVAGSFETVVAVLYGQTVVVPQLPEGYVAWDYDFSKVITEDTTIQAVEAPASEPTGLSDPIVATLAIVLGTLVLVGIAGLVVLQRKGKIVIGRGPNAVKKSEEEKKQ